MEHKRALCAYFNPLQMNCTHVHMSDSQQWVNSFRKRCFVLVHSEVCCGSVRFFEYAANSAGGERLRWGGETLCSRGETGDIILLNEI